MALPVNVDDLINHRNVECARIEYKAGDVPFDDRPNMQADVVDLKVKTAKLCCAEYT